MERNLERLGGIHPHPPRYAHFEAVTVRAAARVLSLANAGEVSLWDVDGYLRDLTGIDRYAAWAGQSALRRLAERRSRKGTPVLRAKMARDASDAPRAIQTISPTWD
jgi:hypothetical protein